MWSNSARHCEVIFILQFEPARLPRGPNHITWPLKAVSVFEFQTFGRSWGILRLPLADCLEPVFGRRISSTASVTTSSWGCQASMPRIAACIIFHQDVWKMLKPTSLPSKMGSKKKSERKSSIGWCWEVKPRGAKAMVKGIISRNYA